MRHSKEAHCFCSGGGLGWVSGVLKVHSRATSPRLDKALQYIDFFVILTFFVFGGNMAGCSDG